jgi:hypothetical protein
MPLAGVAPAVRVRTKRSELRSLCNVRCAPQSCSWKREMISVMSPAFMK